MKINYEEKDLTSFGNYLLSEERAKMVSEVNKHLVTHADFQNWKEQEIEVLLHEPQ